MAKTLNNLAGRLKIGDPQVSGGLTIFSLFVSGGKKSREEEASDQKEIRYLLLEEALDKGTFEVGEVSESGSVNTIIIEFEGLINLLYNHSHKERFVN